MKKRNEFWETDCGDFIVQITDEKASHSLSPALHIPIKKITQKIKERFKVKIKEDVTDITTWVREFLREKIKLRLKLKKENLIFLTTF